MEFPVLKHLRMSDDARRIVIQFLRTPHPTACLMKTLTFERESLEFDDGSKEDLLAISGPHIRSLCDDTFPSVTFPCMRKRNAYGKDRIPKLRAPSDDDCREFAYNLKGGECVITNCIYHFRMGSFCNMLRQERGLTRHIPPRWGPIEPKKLI